MRGDDFRVSVVITSYNQQDYLVDALESVVGQTVRPHEIIVADDGSSDGSQALIRQYEQRFPGWVRPVFQSRNVGIPKNRNAALRMVTGDYVGILDGDDVFLPRKLELQMHALARRPDARAVYGNFLRVTADKTATLGARYARPQPEGDILAEVAALNYGICRTLVVAYDALKTAGFMDEHYTKFDGLWLTIKLATFCRFAYVHEPLVHKREHPGSDSRRNTTEEVLHDLSGIYREMQPLLAPLDGGTVTAISECWQHTMERLRRGPCGPATAPGRARPTGTS
jgi:glycosyltransferase involved in cell wall biosynthesis